MSNKKIEISEHSRFVLLNNLIVSEVRIGKTLFDISSDMANEDNSFKAVIGRIAEHQIDRISKST